MGVFARRPKMVGPTQDGKPLVGSLSHPSESYLSVELPVAAYHAMRLDACRCAPTTNGGLHGPDCVVAEALRDAIDLSTKIRLGIESMEAMGICRWTRG